MPYSNIVWIKLKLEILSDYRFTDKLNDNEKLVFISLLLLAGDTDNKIPEDAAYIKRRLNLNLSIEDIDKSIDKIVATYPKTVAEKGFISFQNFEDYHNFVGGMRGGNPKELQRKSKGTPKGVTDKRREDKEKIKIRVDPQEFILSLKTKPEYKHIHIDNELLKMDTWLAANPGRKKTPRFILRWLNKIEAPIETPKKKERGDV